MNETQLINQYLLHQLPPDEKLLMDARLTLDKDLREKTNWQKLTYGFIQAYGRKNLKQEIARAERELFTHAKHNLFKQHIYRIFNL